MRERTDSHSVSAEARRSTALPWLGIGLAVAASGAVGLGVQVILLQRAAVCIGQGRIGTLGVGAYVAGWSLGAWLAGRSRRAPHFALLLLAPAVPLAAFLAESVLSTLSQSEFGASAVLAFGVAALALAGVPQGAALPLLLRGLEVRSGRAVGRGIAVVYGASLLGSVAGAWSASYGPMALTGILLFGLGMAAPFVLGFGALVAYPGPRHAGSPVWVPASTPGAGGLSAGRAALLVGLATAWMLGLEAIVVRLGVLHLGGMQLGLSALLAAALTSLTLGALLIGPWTPAGPRGVLLLFALASLTSLWPFFYRSDVRADTWPSAYLLALGLAGPSLLPFGAVVPALHRCVAGEGARRLGGLLLHESWGALLGAFLTVQVLVPRVGLGGSIAAWIAIGGLGSLALVRGRPRAAGAAVVGALLAALFAGTRDEPARSSPPLSNPALAVVSFEEDEHFAVTVVDDGLLGERTLLTDEFRAAGTGRDYAYMRALGHLPLLLKPDARRVAVLALGTGTTVGAVSLHAGVERIDVLEISRSVVAAAPAFEGVNRGALAEGLPGLLDDGDRTNRVVVRLGDGRRTLREHGPYDVVTMEPLLPTSPFGVHLYTVEFYDTVRASLAPGGLLCQWIPPHALRPRVFEGVLATACGPYGWASVWVFGTQVFVVSGKDGRPPQVLPQGWERLSGELAAELKVLGLSDTAELFGHEVGRPFVDDSMAPFVLDSEPWILFHVERSAGEVLSDLPRNLAALEACEREPWHGLELPALDRQIQGRAALRAARRAHAWLEVLRVDPEAAVDPAEAGESYLAERLRRATELLGDDTELREFVEHVEFLDRLRLGVGLLTAAAAGQAVEPRSVVDPLTRAAELRPERADVHVYNAAAFAVLGFDEAARKAAAVAVAACPRVAETPAGRRAIALGLPAAYLASAPR